VAHRNLDHDLRHGNRRERWWQAASVAPNQDQDTVLRLGKRQVEWRDRASILGHLSDATLTGNGNSCDLHSRSSLIGSDYRLFAIELKRKRFWESPL
jgi:hypothetical protein